MKRSLSLYWLVALVTLATVPTAARKDRNQPHPHGGILSAYTPGPFDNVALSKQDEQKLEKGEPVMKQNIPDDPNESGGAICVQDVDAPKQAVWNQILDLNSYQQKVPKVKVCQNYYMKKQKDGTFRIKTKQVLGVLPGYSYESYYDHRYYPSKDSMVWTLDYDKTSDFDDVAGHWHVQTHPSKPSCTRVFYACDVKMKGSVPGPILNYISKQALKQATGWVKRESEQNAHAQIPVAFGNAASIAPQ